MDALYVVLILFLFAGCEMAIRLAERVEQTGEHRTDELAVAEAEGE